MKIPTPRRWMVATGGLLLALAPAARAHACVDGTEIVLVGATALLAPSEFGAAISSAGPSADRVVLGWSWQVPISAGTLIRHRLVGGVDLLPHSGGASWRGRLGYRYGRRHAFGGAGVSVDGSGINLSPELGVKFLHAEPSSSSHDEMDLSLHLLARAEIAPDSGHLRGGTILLGWNFL